MIILHGTTTVRGRDKAQFPGNLLENHQTIGTKLEMQGGRQRVGDMQNIRHITAGHGRSLRLIDIQATIPQEPDASIAVDILAMIMTVAYGIPDSGFPDLWGVGYVVFIAVGKMFGCRTLQVKPASRGSLNIHVHSGRA